MHVDLSLRRARMSEGIINDKGIHHTVTSPFKLMRFPIFFYYYFFFFFFFFFFFCKIYRRASYCRYFSKTHRDDKRIDKINIQ